MRRREIAIVAGIALIALAGTVQADIEWPGLRGPNYDGSVRDTELFAGDDAGLAVGWSSAIGSGYSAVAVGNGKVLTMHVGGENDVVSAFDVESGEESWRYEIEPTYAGHSGSHDGPISTPLLTGNRVFGLGAGGKLFALNLEDGSEVWSTHLVDDHGNEAPFYGYTTAPVIVDEVLVVQMGGKEGKAIAGFDPADGKLLWAIGEDEIHYQSPVLATIDGMTQVVAVGNAKLFGIDASEGKILWEYEHGGDGRAIGSGSIVPVPVGNGRFLLENSSDTSKMVQVENNDGAYEVTELWSNNSIRGTYVTPAYHDGYLYGMSGRVFVCVDAATGEVQWKSRQPGDGFPTVIGDKIVVITKPGSLHVIDASPKGYNEIAQIELFDEHSWSEVAFGGGHLFVRSMNELVRVDFGKVDEPAQAAGWVRHTSFGHFLSRVDEAEDKNAVIDAFMARQKGFPIVEAPDVVHFVYRGESNDVGIVGDLIGFRREDPMVHVPGTDLFYYSLRIEPGAAVTYGFIIDFGEEAIPDPMNDRVGSGLFGDVSFFSMPGWKGFAYDDEAATPGTIETVEWESTAKEGAKRTAEVYLPVGYDAGNEYPVVYVHLGQTALEDGKMKNTLDHVVGASVQPLIAVFIHTDEEDPDDTRTPSYYEMVTNELVPLIDEKYSTIEHRAGRASIGSGGGANVALTTAFGSSDLFGRVAAQSANIGFFGPVPMDQLVKNADEQPMTVYLDWGTYHLRSPHEAWDMAEDSREAWAMLRERGYRPVGGERPEGFGWPVWRTHTDELLASLFPN
jgi:enterochelin esterase-like enzyme/outer membrane protein assembly factor BamB